MGQQICTLWRLTLNSVITIFIGRMLSAHVRWHPRPSPQEFKALWMSFFCVCVCLNVQWKMLLYYAAVLLWILAEVRCCLKLFKKLSYCFLFFYHFIQIQSAKLLFQTTSGRDCSACFTEGWGTFLSSTVTHHLSGKLTKQFIVKKWSSQLTSFT